MHEISNELKSKVRGGEALTIGLVCAVLAVSIFIVVGWKLYQSTKGTVQIPGGFKFTWASIKRAFAIVTMRF